MKTCKKCNKECNISLFEIGRNVCRTCRLIQTRSARDKRKVMTVIVKEKACEMCKIVKCVEDFNKASRYKDGLSKYCRECVKNIRWRKPVANIQANVHAIICTSCKKELPISEFRKNARAKNGVFNTCNMCWKPREWNKEKQKASERKYTQANPEKIKEKNKRQGQRLQRRVKDRLRSRITSALASLNYKKSSHTIDYLGCSIDYLKKWFEYQFEDGICWDNYKEWHIDHVIPCDTFNLSSEDEQKKCFNWSNLRPCWKKENLEKSSKIIPSLIYKQQEKAQAFQEINPLPSQSGNCTDGAA